MFTKPAGCFIQLVAALVIFWGIGKLAAKPANVSLGIFVLALGFGLLLLGRKTR